MAKNKEKIQEIGTTSDNFFKKKRRRRRYYENGFIINPNKDLKPAGIALLEMLQNLKGIK